MARGALRFAAALVLTLALLAGASLAGGAPQERVLVGFAGRPDAGLVEALGGRVDQVFSLIPAVAARVPAGALGALRSVPGVAYVEPDGLVWAAGQTLPWGVDRIDAEVVHARGNKGDNVKACIIDTGIDMDHPDLAVLGGYDFVNKDSNPDDDNGHGTHAAGVVAALDNDQGVIGVAPLAHLYAAKVLDATGSGSVSNIVAALDWAVQNGMKVVDMSIKTSTNYSSLKTACDNANSAGLLLFAPSGSAGGSATKDTLTYPGRYTSVVAVGATDQSNVRASFSSTGPGLELVAPGVSIYSTYKGGGYYTMSGTSMSTPHAAGTAALVWSTHPTWTNQQVRDRLNSTATDLGAAGKDWEYGYGLVNAAAAAQ